MKTLFNPIIARPLKLARKYPGLLVFASLAVMGLLGLGSMVGNSAIVDEVAHIPAGYAYLHYQDYRLNPEHPPLLKDLAALPLQFMNLKFPENLPAWTTEVNGQWEVGWNFLYHLGNDADAILFWSRLPILCLALLFGVVLFEIVRRRWGNAAGVLAVFFYALSPNILAHSNLVTTDLGSSISMFVALWMFARYIEKPTKINFLWLSLVLAMAQMVKFSATLLYPFLGLFALGMVGVMRHPEGRAKRLVVYVGGFLGASALSLVWIWMYYATQVARMPIEVQDKLIRGSLQAEHVRAVADFLLTFNHWPLMKPLAQYLLGLAMVGQRVQGGNVTYFNGQVTENSFNWYFPELFSLKTQLSLLIIGLVLLVAAVWRWRGLPVPQWPARLTVSMRRHLLEWLLGLFAVFYFIVAVAGNLNLGIRHILPVYIPIFVLVAVGSVRLWRRMKLSWRKPALAIFGLLLAWYGVNTVVSYPNYLSYFNEVILGQGNSGKYFSDSSVDWGQDLKRLKTYIEEQHINKIAVDYFGGGVPAYYFCARKYDAMGQLVQTAEGYDCTESAYQEWHAQNGIYTGQYIAVSETFLENDRYYARIYQRPGYDYLRAREPIAKIGNSIYVFKLY